jgi:type IV secretory pathway VirB2 component (pilin)
MEIRKQSNFMLLLLLAVMCLETTVFGATGDATEILKDTAKTQISGDIGFLIILGGVAVAALTMMFQKNLFVPVIILIGSIVLAMSPDLTDGIIQQFGS